MAKLPGGNPDEANRRQELIRVAAQQFRQKGFNGTSTRDIADAVGMHAGSPFYHFKTKQALLLAVMEEGLQDALAMMESIAKLEIAPREKFKTLLRTHLATILERDQDAMTVLLYDWRSLSPEGQRKIISLKDRYEAIWQETLDALGRTGELHDSSKVGRFLIFGALNWIVQWYREGHGLTIDEIVERAMALFLCPHAAPAASPSGKKAKR